MKRLFWRVYLYFGVVLMALTGVIALSYSELNKNSVEDTYYDQLESLGSQVAYQISQYVSNQESEAYFHYLDALENFGKMQNTDIWVVSNKKAKKPLAKEYTNISLTVAEMEKQTRQIVRGAFKGNVRSYSSYDEIYGSMVLHIAEPIYNDGGKVIGAVLLNEQMATQENSINQSRYVLLLSLLIALVLGAILSIFFSRQIASPITGMNKVAGQLAIGNYRTKTGVRRRDEIGELAKTMDKLAFKLQEAKDVQDNMEKTRRDFFSSVSHELRTPITVVKGYTEALCDGVVSDPALMADYFERMKRECNSMERLVSDLLILSRMQNPDFTLEVEELSIIAVLQDVIRSMRILAKEKQIKVEFKYEDPCCFINGDYDRIRQLFIILLDNALKYSNSNSEVEISVIGKEKQFSVKFSDHGTGIKEEDLPYIFDKFYRAEDTKDRDGSGIGLVLAKEIVTKHGGTIETQSVYGEGTTFIINFNGIIPVFE